jgi:hypothetical protein
MINFQSLELVVHETYSFLELKSEMIYFSFAYLKDLMSISLRLTHLRVNEICFSYSTKSLTILRKFVLKKGYLEENSELSTQDRDGVINTAGGSEIQDDEDGSENIFYSKLDIIGRLLNAYDEPKILALAYRLGKSDKFDVSQIHRYLHQAVYLQNHAAYVDQMVLPQRVVQFESTDIVTMYCYLFCESKQQLER